MHRFFVSAGNEPWAADLVHRINIEALRLDLPLDARVGHVEGEDERRFPYSAYIEIERLDTHQLLYPGLHFEGFMALAERLESAEIEDVHLDEGEILTPGRAARLRLRRLERLLADAGLTQHGDSSHSYTGPPISL
jgi:hypothetical protein